jgi:hypothetical protein
LDRVADKVARPSTSLAGRYRIPLALSSNQNAARRCEIAPLPLLRRVITLWLRCRQQPAAKA